MKIEDTLTQRGPTHGTFSEQAKTHDSILALMIRTPNFMKLNAAQRQALNAISGKISRILHGDFNHEDHWHDIAGYATLAEKNCAPDPSQLELKLEAEVEREVTHVWEHIVYSGEDETPRPVAEWPISIRKMVSEEFTRAHRDYGRDLELINSTILRRPYRNYATYYAEFGPPKTEDKEA